MKVEFAGTRKEIVDQIFEFLKFEDFADREIKLPIFWWQEDTSRSRVNRGHYADFVNVKYVYDEMPRIDISFNRVEWSVWINLNDKGLPEMTLWRGNNFCIAAILRSEEGKYEISVRELPVESAPQQQKEKENV